MGKGRTLQCTPRRGGGGGGGGGGAGSGYEKVRLSRGADRALEMAVSPGGTHAETATLRTADGLLCHGVPAAFGRNVGRLAAVQVVRAQPDLADEPLRNRSEARDALVLVTRGAVPFVEKVRRAAAAGAAAVVIVNNVNEPYVAHGHQYPDGRIDDGEGIAIPVVCVRLGDGSALARRLPCRATLDFCDPKLPLPPHGSGETTAVDLHTPPPLPRRTAAGATSADLSGEARSPETPAHATATTTVGAREAGLGSESMEQANFTPDALHSPAAPQGSPTSPMSPKQLAARASAAGARAAKQRAQAATVTSAKTMQLAQQREQKRQHMHQPLAEMQSPFMYRAASAGVRTDCGPQVRTSSEESFLAHERYANLPCADSLFATRGRSYGQVNLT